MSRNIERSKHRIVAAALRVFVSGRRSDGLLSGAANRIRIPACGGITWVVENLGHASIKQNQIRLEGTEP
jgi:hypothetical protein